MTACIRRVSAVAGKDTVVVHSEAGRWEIASAAAAELQLGPGVVVTAELQARLEAAGQRRAAAARALRSLRRRPRTESEVQGDLERAGFAPEIAFGVLAELRLEADNVRRFVASGQARAWVEAHKGRWCHNDWLALLSRLRYSEFWPLEPAALGRELERIGIEWRNLQRWQATGEPHRWVRQRRAHWDDSDWSQLVATLRRSRFWPLELADVGQLLDQLLEHGGVRGDMTTVCNTGCAPDYAATTGAGYRLIADLGISPPKLLAVDAQSQSGHPGSPHYADQFETWLDGGYHEVPLNREEAMKVASTETLLEPERCAAT